MFTLWKKKQTPVEEEAADVNGLLAVVLETVIL